MDRAVGQNLKDKSKTGIIAWGMNVGQSASYLELIYLRELVGKVEADAHTRKKTITTVTAVL